MTWKLATVSVAGKDRVAIAADGRLVDVAKLARQDGGLDGSELLTMLSVLEDWDRWHSLLESASREDLSDPAIALPVDARLRAPVLYPRKLFCAGANYGAHVREMGTQVPDKATTRPYFFLKPPTTTVIGPNEPVRMPSNTRKLDWEIELAAVIGRSARNVPLDRAAEHVAGYTIVNDISARDIHRREDWPKDGPFYWDWLQSKGCDTFAPMGPYLVPRGQIADPYNLRLKLSVNGQVMQDANTSDLIFDVEEQIAYLSTMYTLEPGDVIATGTPPGVGAGRGVFLQRGDVIVAEIEQIGTLRNPVE